jgi:predicted 3-demethylubiquinone-9 3-methyltransferase (glyoxalase superfamily)
MNVIKRKIVPFLWFDKVNDEAANLYLSAFSPSSLRSVTKLPKAPSGAVEIYAVDLLDSEFHLMSAGPEFKFTPAISFLVTCNRASEVDHIWQKLVAGGSVLIELGSYPFSERYGWLADKFGVSWQIMFTGEQPVRQRIIPFLMFTGEQFFRADEAIQFYTSIFPNSGVEDIQRYHEGEEPNQPGSVKFAEFKLDGQLFAAMDSYYDHGFTFNEAISLVGNCETQEEMDYYWEKLSADPEAEMCGWLKDRFGVSWQIVPTIMYEMQQTQDADRLARVTEAFLQMKKFDIAALQKAYEGD